jgi:hypothetical protein
MSTIKVRVFDGQVAYRNFVSRVRQSIEEENPELDDHQIILLIAKKWKELGDYGKYQQNLMFAKRETAVVENNCFFILNESIAQRMARFRSNRRSNPS